MPKEFELLAQLQLYRCKKGSAGNIPLATLAGRPFAAFGSEPIPFKLD